MNIIPVDEEEDINPNYNMINVVCHFKIYDGCKACTFFQTGFLSLLQLYEPSPK